MFCKVCHTQLPQSSAFCPQCGTTVVPDSASETIIQPDFSIKQEEMTPPSAEKGLSGTTQEQYLYPPPPPNVPYNNVPLPQYYNAVPQDPYNVPPPLAIPPQSRPPRRGLKTAIILSIIVVVLLTSCVTIFTAMSNAINNGLKAMVTTPYSTSTPSTSSTQNTLSPVAQQPNPYVPFRGQLVLADPLRDNSQGNKWSEANNASLYCQFTAGTYHLRLTPQSQYQIDWCFSTTTSYSNLAFEVEMTMIKGDCAGLIFHNAGDRELYYFCITHLGGYGLYLYYKDNTGAVQVKELAKGNSSLIYTGYNTKNLIAASANDGTINLYVNHKQIQSVIDKTFLQGEIGLATHEYESKETDVSYQNAKIWTF